MSDNESNDNRSSDEDEEQEESEVEESEETESKDQIRRFSNTGLAISSKEVKVEILPKGVNTSNLLRRLQNINMELDRVGNNLNDAVSRYNANTKSVKNAQIFNCNQSQMTNQYMPDNNQINGCHPNNKPIPQKFDNFNNPYKKITNHGYANKYSNDVRDLYKNQFNDYSMINNKTTIDYNNTDQRKGGFGNYSIKGNSFNNFSNSNFQSSGTYYPQNDKVNKVYYRRTNEMN